MTASYVLKKVPLTELYLDPNNPRYSELGEGTRKVPEGRVREDGVQRKARERLALANLELDKLQDSIRTVGFLPIDPMIVVPLPDAHSYMVIEGNRRLAALKQVAEDQESGEIDLDPSIFKTIRTVNVLVVDSEDEQERNHLARVFQGVRHVSGVKPWGPYQQAGLISSMSDDGRSMQDIKEALGLSAKRINVLHKVYSA
ncbi:MAG TPA: ParB/Srx family N-terminal domain-containing protein, partial [Chloroflexota bacterium]|nr:ParB/Srx family N-terminal domain-containing protein [Chloroflexota bacterium]